MHFSYIAALAEKGSVKINTVASCAPEISNDGGSGKRRWLRSYLNEGDTGRPNSEGVELKRGYQAEDNGTNGASPDLFLFVEATFQNGRKSEAATYFIRRSRDTKSSLLD